MTESEKMIMRGIIALHREIKSLMLGQCSPNRRDDIDKSLDNSFFELLINSENSQSLNQWLDEIMEKQI